MGEWISVKDKQPENDSRVLVLVGKTVDIDNYDGRCGSEPWAVYKVSCITHWMPLPEPIN